MCKGGCGNKPAIWIDSGIHAREWISPAVGTWMLNELVENNTAHPELTERLDWYFLPVQNPDGYAKTMVQTEDYRYWRKTTSKYNSEDHIDGGFLETNTFTLDSDCIGTDLNRNYDYLWGTVQNFLN